MGPLHFESPLDPVHIFSSRLLTPSSESTVLGGHSPLHHALGGVTCKYFIAYIGIIALASYINAPNGITLHSFTGAIFHEDTCSSSRTYIAFTYKFHIHCIAYGQFILIFWRHTRGIHERSQVILAIRYHGRSSILNIIACFVFCDGHRVAWMQARARCELSCWTVGRLCLRTYCILRGRSQERLSGI